jgi:hypothetical protein
MDSQIDENLSFAKYQTGNACHVSHPEKSKSKKNDHHKSGVNFLQNLAAEDIIYASRYVYCTESRAIGEF